MYFVLGNHDFYRGSIQKTRQRVVETVKQARHLTYLTATEVVALTPQTALVGHDGWADTRLGDFNRSEVVLNDFRLIEELAACCKGATLDKSGLKPTMMALADEAARHFESVLKQAAAKFTHIIAATHVPPFRAAAWYDGRIADSNLLPYFASKVAGEAMQKVIHPPANQAAGALRPHARRGRRAGVGQPSRADRRG